MPSFILDRPSADEDTYIFVLVQCWDGRLKTSTREKVHPDNWDSAAQRPKVVKGDSKARAQLIKISRVFDALVTLETNCEITGDKFTKGMVKKTIEDVLNFRKPIGRIKFEDAALQIIQEMKDGILTNQKGGKYSFNTIKHYNHTLNALKNFKKATKLSIEFGDVTMNTYNRFIEYCNSQNWTLNTTGTHIKNWKQFFERGAERGWHTSRIHLEKAFKTLHEDTYDIALNEKELQRIIDQNLLKEEQVIARDWFLIGCYTGLRVSDLKTLTKDKVHGDTLFLSNEKTDEKVAIPIHAQVKKIMKKWKGFPPSLAEQTINEKIKEVAELSKINEKVLYTVT